MALSQILLLQLGVYHAIPTDLNRILIFFFFKGIPWIKLREEIGVIVLGFVFYVVARSENDLEALVLLIINLIAKDLIVILLRTPV